MTYEQKNFPYFFSEAHRSLPNNNLNVKKPLLFLSKVFIFVCKNTGRTKNANYFVAVSYCHKKGLMYKTVTRIVNSFCLVKGPDFLQIMLEKMCNNCHLQFVSLSPNFQEQQEMH